MIARIEGEVLRVGSGEVLIGVSGIGFSVVIASGLAASLRAGQVLALEVVLVVRQDALTLFGFETRSQKTVFDELLKVGGVGPRLAMAILSSLSPGEIASAVSSGDDRVLQRVSGVGKKLAGTILIHLVGKLDTISLAASTTVDSEVAVRENAVSALVQLGWKQAVARPIIEDIADNQPGITVSDLLRQSLKKLGRGGAR